MIVATETGRWPFALLDVPVWQLLYVYHHLGERDARRSVERRAARVDAGILTALAMHEPARLDDELRSVRDAMDTIEYEASALDPDRLRADGLALAARIAAGRAMDAAALRDVATGVASGGLVS